MPVKINELVIQVKVVESGSQSDKEVATLPDFLSNTIATESQKLALARDVLHLLEDRNAR